MTCLQWKTIPSPMAKAAGVVRGSSTALSILTVLPPLVGDWRRQDIARAFARCMQKIEVTMDIGTVYSVDKCWLFHYNITINMIVFDIPLNLFNSAIYINFLRSMLTGCFNKEKPEGHRRKNIILRILWTGATEWQTKNLPNNRNQLHGNFFQQHR